MLYPNILVGAMVALGSVQLCCEDANTDRPTIGDQGIQRIPTPTVLSSTDVTDLVGRRSTLSAEVRENSLFVQLAESRGEALLCVLIALLTPVILVRMLWAQHSPFAPLLFLTVWTIAWTATCGVRLHRLGQRSVVIGEAAAYGCDSLAVKWRLSRAL